MSMDAGQATHAGPGDDVLDWLLAGDPAIRWQVMRDLMGAAPRDVAAERSRVAREGWGATLLAAQAPDGRWGGATWNRGWDSTMHALLLLREFGLDPECAAARRALALVRDGVTWRGCGPPECGDNAFFEGETEPCINAQVAAAGAYFGVDVSALVGRVLGEQLADGGWNCEAERGSTRSSFHTTIGVLEALQEFERGFGARAEVTAARRRGEEYLLVRGLFRRLSTGEPIAVDRKSRGDSGGAPAFSRFAFPVWWHYDVLRGLECLRAAGVVPDARAADAVALVVSKRGPDGRWPLEMSHPGAMLVDLGEPAGTPSRWITLRAWRVLKWWAAR